MHQQCIDAGLACYLEKPPTLDPLELDAMVKYDLHAKLFTAVGFNHIGQTERLELKQRILAGEFGALNQARFVGAWRRSCGYFHRNAWAGRLLLGEQLVLDSCFGNGMAHHLHNLLFFCGTGGLYSWAKCVSLESELYSVQPIEGPDTVFAQGLLESGVVVRIAVTNVCKEIEYTSEELYFDHAQIHIAPNDHIKITWNDGRKEKIPLTSDRLLEQNIRNFLAYLDGEFERPPTTLEDCQAFVQLNALTYLASQGICRLEPTDYAFVPETKDKKSVRYIHGILDCQRHFADSGNFPSSQGVSWGKKGGYATVEQLENLHSHVQLIQSPKVACVKSS